MLGDCMWSIVTGSDYYLSMLELRHVVRNLQSFCNESIYFICMGNGYTVQ